MASRIITIYVLVLQRAVDQPRWTDRFPENVQYMVRAGYRKRCGATLWGARHHADGNGPFYRTCKLSNNFAALRHLLNCLCCAQYHRTVPFDSILGGGKVVYTIHVEFC
jgi:hypothetical protein